MNDEIDCLCSGYIYNWCQDMMYAWYMLFLIALLGWWILGSLVYIYNVVYKVWPWIEWPWMGGACLS